MTYTVKKCKESEILPLFLYMTKNKKAFISFDDDGDCRLKFLSGKYEIRYVIQNYESGQKYVTFEFYIMNSPVRFDGYITDDNDGIITKLLEFADCGVGQNLSDYIDLDEEENSNKTSKLGLVARFKEIFFGK